MKQSKTSMTIIITGLAFLVIGNWSCKDGTKEPSHESLAPPDTVASAVQKIPLTEPYATESVKNYAKVTPWPGGQIPSVPTGFKIIRFADSLKNPRWIYTGDNGDVFVAESNSAHSALEKISGKNKSEDRITLLRDADHDGMAEQRFEFLTGLNKPFGMLITGNHFYVANTDGILVYPYEPGMTALKGKGVQILKLPGGPRHWTRNILASNDKTKIFVAVGSSSDHAENGLDKEVRRANILSINTDGTGEKVFASGIRNPVGMDLIPGTNDLWTVVNERDELGDELVPDYLTQVKENGFYGWPWSYYGDHPDPRVKEGQKPTGQVIVPDLSLGSHTASLGLKFYTGNSFPARYLNGAFIGQHGSWNKSRLVGYKVSFVPFKDGHPSGIAEDFVNGFVADSTKQEVHGRPVGIAMTNQGDLLIADDAGNTIWEVRNTTK